MNRAIKHIIIHCAATPNFQHVTREDIDRMHGDRGFNRSDYWRERFNPTLKHIGYHHVIHLDGVTVTGRHEDEIGAHVQGQNASSIGICMIGTDRFSKEQWTSLAGLVDLLAARYPSADILGHRDYSPDLNGDGVIDRTEWIKICPGFDVKAWRAAGMQPFHGEPPIRRPV